MNSHITKFLEYYFLLDNEPNYAVLINGRWGCGKTWFIKNSMSAYSQTQDLKFFYISLYGFSNTSQIDDELFKQLHPILSHKGIVFASSILKAVAKGTVNIDFDGDGKSDASVSASIPTIKMQSMVKNPSKIIIIFDDLERCLIPIKECLGYINHFTEHNGCKVVILASEDDGLSHDKDYVETKEKVIGVTFNLEINAENAFDSFIKTLTSKKLLVILESDKAEFLAIYKSSCCTNLRLLRHFIFDFERLYLSFDEKIKNNDAIIKRIFHLHFIFLFESKENNLCLYSTDVGLYYLNEDRRSPYEALTEKYKQPIFADTLISQECWDKIINGNIIEVDAINREILTSKIVDNPKTPEWILLWGYRKLTDDEFIKYRKNVWLDLMKCNFNNVNVVKHVVGTLIELSRNKLFSTSPESILERGMKNIDFILKNGEVVFPKQVYDKVFNDSWGGLCFHASDSYHFKMLSKYISKAEKIEEEACHKKTAEKIIDLIEHNDNDFCPMLNVNNIGVNSHYDVPILKYIEPNIFFNAMLNSSEKSFIGHVIQKRYEEAVDIKKLLPELLFLKNINDLINSYVSSHNTRLSSYVLRNDVSPKIVSAIQYLENKM